MRRIISFAVVLAVLVPMGAQPSQATFPGSNGKLAFVSFGDGPNRIGVIGPNGNGLTFLTSPERRLDWEPSWSDDGEMIVFDTLTREYDHPKIMTMAADGTDPTVVYEAPDRVKDIYRPVWSPDATQIAFCGAVGRAYLLQIFTMNADGSSVTNISGSKHPDDCSPDWSPDGTKIAFSPGGVVTMDPDGTGRTVVVADGRWPSWSPDGAAIAFERRVDRQSDIFVVDVEGSDVTRLTDTARRFEQTPAFSPDGALLAYSRGANQFVFDDRDLFTVALVDLSVTRVADTRRSEYTVAWQPGPT